MTTIIKDGRSGQTAKVDDKNRLATAATTTSAQTQSAIDANQFNIHTSVITLTTANESALLYVKNSEASPITWALTNLTITGAESTGGSGVWEIAFNKNASAGTLISAGAVISPTNLNLGSTSPLAGTFLKGVEGSTITDGQTKVNTLVPIAPGVLAASLEVIAMPQGTAISVFVTPPAGNTSMKVTVSITLYRLVEV